MASKGRFKRVVIHPGEILREDFMEELGLSATALAKALGVSPPTVNDVVRGRRGITADMALRLQQYFGTSAEMWMGLQLQYELDVAKATRLPAIRKAVKPRPAMPKAA
jgi:antitoxin HigA-1